MISNTKKAEKPQVSPRIIVIGGGPAGILAAGRAAQCGASVLLIEKNLRIGWKLSITGKGRANLTNMSEIEHVVEAFGSEGKFLYGPLNRFSPQDLITFFEKIGLPVKTERGNRVFPQSDKAQDVVDVLTKWMKKTGVEVALGTKVTSIETQEDRVIGVKTIDRTYPADAVILCTGGMSYSKTGSTGDGYRFARKLGHTIHTPRPGLIPLETAEPDIPELQGLSLKNVTATIYLNGQVKESEFGEMLFTHFGVSGPIILTLSRQVVDYLPKGRVDLSINLKPSLTEEQIHKRLIKDLAHRQALHNYLPQLLPRKMLSVFVKRLHLSEDKVTTQITSEERRAIVNLLRNFRMQITRPRPLEEAIVTAGGVDLREVDSRTMESKKVKGLYFAGELLDLCGVTGGFNLQAAFSTGHLAGESAAKSICDQ